MNSPNNQLLRPTQFAETSIIRSILNHTFPPHSHLPSERELALQIGVTRPTLRETLQRLAREGWISIRHGKPTLVNDYWAEGGLGMLGTMAQFADFLPENFIQDLLEVRVSILPACARAAAERAPLILLDLVNKSPEMGDGSETFAVFDWQLQETMVRHSGNCVFPLILNDFRQIYKRLATGYFEFHVAKESSLRYYQELRDLLPGDPAGVEAIVHGVMKESIAIWLRIQSKQIKGKEKWN